MKPIVKKGLLTALGAASIAADTADKLLKDIAKNVNIKDVKTLAKKLAKDGKRMHNVLSVELKKRSKEVRPLITKGQKAISKARKELEKARRMAEKRGKEVINRTTKRLK